MQLKQAQDYQTLQPAECLLVATLLDVLSRLVVEEIAWLPPTLNLELDLHSSDVRL